jgi:hypothetical protein
MAGYIKSRLAIFYMIEHEKSKGAKGINEIK